MLRAHLPQAAEWAGAPPPSDAALQPISLTPYPNPNPNPKPKPHSKPNPRPNSEPKPNQVVVDGLPQSESLSEATKSKVEP